MKVRVVTCIFQEGRYHTPGTILELPHADAAMLVLLGSATTVDNGPEAPAIHEPPPAATQPTAGLTTNPDPPKGTKR